MPTVLVRPFYLDFVEPLTAYNEAKSLTLAEPRLRCAKQTEQLGFCSVQSRHRQYRRPGSPLNNHVRQTRSAGHNLKPCRDSGEQRQGWPASRYVSAILMIGRGLSMRGGFCPDSLFFV
jgi:hypothetical protein